MPWARADSILATTAEAPSKTIESRLDQYEFAYITE
jgi:hypothetical protein